jgi:peptidoglycan-associated lipoprotein
LQNFFISCAKINYIKTKQLIKELVIMLKKAAVALCALVMLAGCKGRSAYSSYANEESSENVVYFDYDSSDIRSEAKDKLMKHVDMLKANPSLSIVVEGHCDERGTREYNIALGERRAHAVKRFLVSHMGAAKPHHRIETISYGKERPAVIGEGEEVYRLNRRAVIKPKK